MTKSLVQSLAAVSLFSTPISAMTLLQVEFNQDDQAEFDLWPAAFAGSESVASFSTDASATSGTTAVTISTSSGFGIPANRAGSTNGTPAGYTYQNLYEDLLIATGPTGALTLNFSGLNANETYGFTLYAWDPGATDASDKVWDIEVGTGTPDMASVNFQDALVDNETFALEFEVTTDAAGTFQITNSAGTPQSAINGFRLTSDNVVPEPSAALLAALGLLGFAARRKR